MRNPTRHTLTRFVQNSHACRLQVCWSVGVAPPSVAVCFLLSWRCMFDIVEAYTPAASGRSKYEDMGVSPAARFGEPVTAALLVFPAGCYGDPRQDNVPVDAWRMSAKGHDSKRAGYVWAQSNPPGAPLVAQVNKHANYHTKPAIYFPVLLCVLYPTPTPNRAFSFLFFFIARPPSPPGIPASPVDPVNRQTFPALPCPNEDGLARPLDRSRQR